jgi:hypothetical protein
MSLEHPFGVDQLGRDIFSRVVHGAHIVILLSLDAARRRRHDRAALRLCRRLAR